MLMYFMHRPAPCRNIAVALCLWFEGKTWIRSEVSSWQEAMCYDLPLPAMRMRHILQNIGRMKHTVFRWVCLGIIIALVMYLISKTMVYIRSVSSQAKTDPMLRPVVLGNEGFTSIFVLSDWMKMSNVLRNVLARVWTSSWQVLLFMKG